MNKKSIIGVIVSFAVCISSFAFQPYLGIAYADDGSLGGIVLGSNNVCDTLVDSSGHPNETRIWYGDKSGIDSNTITNYAYEGSPYWRAINSNSSNSQAYLLSEYVWRGRHAIGIKFGSNAYTSSPVRSVINTLYNSGLFSETEKNAMVSHNLSTTASKLYSMSSWIADDTTIEDKLFAPSVTELHEYMSSVYSPNINWNNEQHDIGLYTNRGPTSNTNSTTSGGPFSSGWWVRQRLMNSSGDTHPVAVSGNRYDGGWLESVYPDTGNTFLRPAFVLDLNKVVLMSTAKNGKKSGPTGAAGLKIVNPNTTNDWKVTILDENRDDFTVGSVTKNVNNNTISFIYSGATVGDNEFLSAIVVDENGRVKYYGRILDLAQGNSRGSAIVDISLCDTNSSDKLYIINEQCNGDNLTDYSSQACEVSQLFSHTIEHSLTEVEAVAPTCTASGHSEYWSCYACERFFGDAEGNEEIALESTVIPATNHPNLHKTDAVAPRCLEPGNVEYWTCTDCGAIFRDAQKASMISESQTVVPATDHAWGEWTYYDENQHQIVCGNDESHKKYGNHEWADYYIADQAATCTSEGSETIHCTICLASKPETERIIPITEHNYGDWIVVEEATCTTDGVREKVCEGCGDKIIETIDALTHNWNEEMTIDIPATCTTDGSKSYHCSRCSETRNVTVIPATGHEFGEWETINPSTCEGTGLKKHTCDNCGYSETEGINPNGHYWDESLTVDVPATCTTDGSQSYHCKNCEAIKDSEVIPSPGHTWETTSTVDIPATCTEDGSQSKHCSVCGEKSYVEVIPAINHKWNAPTYTWSKDYKTVTATRVCKNNKSHKETETVKTTSKVTKKATYTAKGQTTYTAAFKNGAFKTQTKILTNIAKLPKKANTIVVKVKKPTVKFSALKKKAQIITVKKAFAVSKAQGNVTYKKVSGNAKITINSAGKITVKKGLKKAIYKVKVKVTAAGNTTYKAGAKTVTLTIRVK